MRVRLEATLDELADKGDALVEQLSRAFEDANPDLADRLHKALPTPPPELPYRVLRDLHADFAAAYAKQMEAMVRDIGRVLDQSKREVRKSLDDETLDKATHTYIKRERKGDHWVYTYADDAKHSKAPQGAISVKMASPLTPDEMVAAEDWQGGGFRSIQRQLRDVAIDPKSKRGVAIAQVVRGLDSAIKKSVLTKPAVVYRGHAEDTYRGAQVGSVVQDPGYWSATSDYHTATTFASPAHSPAGHGSILVISHKPGQAVLDMNQHIKHTAMEEESEILLQRNARYRVTRVDDSGPQHIVHMERLDGSMAKSASHKYVSREKKGDRWVYTYADTSGPSHAPAAPAPAPIAAPVHSSGDEPAEGGPERGKDIDGFRTSKKTPITKDEANAVRMYQTHFDVLNAAARTGKAPTGVDVNVERVSKHLDGAISKSIITKRMITYRGVSGDAGLPKDLKEGVTFTDKGYLSTSSQRDIAEAFADREAGQKGTLLVVHSTTGQTGLRVNDHSDDDDMAQQHEILLPRNCRLKVFKVETSGGLRVVHVQRVGAF